MAASLRLLVIVVLCSFSPSLPVYANNLPVVSFEGLSHNQKIAPESTALGTELFNITATDSDGDSITITIETTETDHLVSLDLQPQNGNARKARVLLKSRLDRDRSPPTRILYFNVKGGRNEEIPMEVKLSISDVNDNPPFFENLPYRLSLPERTNRTASVFRVYASDPDSSAFGAVTYSMMADDESADKVYNSTFVIQQPRSGIISLEEDLDYETRSYYQYKVTARDIGPPSCPGQGCLCNNVTEPVVDCKGIPAIFTVTITDVQDTPPHFEGLPYYRELHEDAAVNTSVLTVSALDGDRGVPNKVNYTILCDSCPFSIDPNSGLITVNEPGLDADLPGGRSYDVTVMATEIPREANQEQFGNTTATTSVSITVLDVNDNKPEFSHTVYHGSVQENTPLGVPISINPSITVEDRDQGSNSQFRLSVKRDGHPFYVFSTLPSSDITGSSTVMVSVNDSAFLDYEKRHNFTFQLEARESHTSEEFYNLTTVIVSIIDMNDNSPLFTENQTKLINITEDSEVGKLLGTFTATDEDSGDFGTIAYSLEDDFEGRFNISSETGELHLQKELDRDSGDERFSLVVVASDSIGASSQNQRRSARHSVLVMVEDVNDNTPQFLDNTPTEVAVQENAEVNTTLVILKATDKDQGANGDVRYKVASIHRLPSPSSATAVSTTTPTPALFDIKESTGEVFVSASLISHPGSFNVTIVASDRGQEPRKSTSSLTVLVRDFNDNRPKFINPDQDLVNKTANIVPNITVLEELPPDTLIMQLSASDEDAGVNGLVNFFLDPDLAGAFLNFQVDPVSGNLSNRFRLDSDGEHDSYQITLRAQDQGTPLPLSSTIPFIIFLKDIDDNPPEFPPEASPLRLQVKEMAANVPVGFVNVSIDKDRDPKNRQTCYYLSGGEMQSFFVLDKASGELRLMRKLDRTQTTNVTLQVKATRNCSLEADHFITTTGNSSTDMSVLEVRVEVEDINNHPPVFQNKAPTVGLLSDVDPGTVVTDLAAYVTDLDTAEHSKHMFRLLKFMGPNSSPGSSLDSTFFVSVNGSVVTRRLFKPDEGGNFVLTVQAYDVDNLTDTANLTIYLVSNQERVKLIFNGDPNEVDKIKGDMVKRLGEILGLTIIADKVATHITSEGTPDPKRTDVFIHARYIPSGEIVPTTELVSAFDYNEKVLGIFRDYGVAYISPLEQDEEKDDEQKVFIIVILALAIVTVALALVLFTSVRRYRRKLRAATTTAFVSTKDMPANLKPPGTNQYMSENPIFGKDLKTDDFLRTEDKDNDSLDDNEVDGGGGDHSRKPLGPRMSGEGGEPDEEQEMYLDMYDDDVGNSSGQHISHLAMVLKEYDTHAAQSGNSHKPAAGVPASGQLGGRSEMWGPSPHARSREGTASGHHNHGFEEDLDNLQTTDI